jgi:signal transduction histidine kinase
VSGAETTTVPAEPALTAARARWLVLQEELLRGVTHALSNRVATLSAAAYMLEYEDVTPAQAADSLRVESERMDALLQLLRQLPARGEPGCEPVVPTDVVAQATLLHAQHCDLRELPVTVASADDVLPCWVDPHVLLQALLLLLTTVKRQTGAQAVHVQVDGDVDTVRVTVTTDAVLTWSAADARARADVDAADRLLAGAAGRAGWPEAGGVELVLPSLPAARRAGR